VKRACIVEYKLTRGLGNVNRKVENWKKKVFCLQQGKSWQSFNHTNQRFGRQTTRFTRKPVGAALWPLLLQALAM
jgi:hypothetical protein